MTGLPRAIMWRQVQINTLFAAERNFIEDGEVRQTVRKMTAPQGPVRMRIWDLIAR